MIDRRISKEPRRQILEGIMLIHTLTLIIGEENIERVFNIHGKNRRKTTRREEDKHE